MGLGAPEILIILVVLLLLFGSTRLPSLARSLGQASNEFRAGVRDKGTDRTEVVAKAPADPTSRPAANAG